MTKPNMWKIACAVLVLCAATAPAAASADSQINVIYNSPVGYLAGVVLDKEGNLFVGNYDGGTIVELSPAQNNQWTATTIYTFGGLPDPWQILSSMVFDSAGNLYGASYNGGTGSCINEFEVLVGCGTVFELSPGANGQWSEKVLYSFTNSPDGAYPYGGVTFDAKGNLYGTTTIGGAASAACPYGCGIAFELSPGGNGQWTETVLHNFGTMSDDGQYPYSTPIVDAKGRVFGTTQFGGSHVCQYGSEAEGCGTVFILTPSRDGQWSEGVVSFNGEDGEFPYAGLASDALGNLYGVAMGGGKYTDCPCGTLFRLSPNSSGHWSGAILHYFDGGDGPDGASPWGGVMVDSAGNIYGTTAGGGNRQAGTVFQLAPMPGGKWLKSTRSFGGWNGEWPRSTPVLDAEGNLYGTTYTGGKDARGVVFEILR